MLAAELARFADADRETLRVEPVEKKLCDATRASCEVAKASERDLTVVAALRDDDVSRTSERLGVHDGAVAQPNGNTMTLQLERRLAVIETKGLEPGRGDCSHEIVRGRRGLHGLFLARQTGAPVADLEPEERNDAGGPLPSREERGDRHSLHATLCEVSVNVRAHTFEPATGYEPGSVARETRRMKSEIVRGQ